MALKFRVWDKSKKKMIFTSLEKFSKDMYNNDFHKKDCIIMEFTGLKDKKNKDIYEGDVLEYTLTHIEGNPKHKVVIDIKSWSSVCSSIYGFDFGDFGDDPDEYAEVIGNIHENPKIFLN